MKQFRIAILLFSCLMISIYGGGAPDRTSAANNKGAETFSSNVGSALPVPPLTAAIRPNDDNNFLDARENQECPEGKPLDCRNGWCCPRGYTLHCPKSNCTGVPDGGGGCYNPDKLTSEQLAALRNCCPGLVSCS